MSAPESAAKAALEQLLIDHFAALDVAAEPADKVLVTYGPPPQDTINRRVVWIQGHDTDDDWAAVGAQSIAATIDVRLVIDVTYRGLGGDPPRDVDDDGAGVANEIRNAVRTAVRAKTPIADGIEWAGVKRTSSPDGPLPTENGAWVVTQLQTVQFKARLR